MRPAKMLGELLRSLFRRPATVLYPFERLEVPDRFRGRVAFDPLMLTGMRQQPDFAFPTPSRNTYFLPVDDFVEKPVAA